MTKRPSASENADLIMEIFKRIPERNWVSARHIHEQLQAADINRDIRSIQRQLDKLAKTNKIEQNADTKPYGYRRLHNPHTLDIAGLSAKESLLLTLAEEHLRHLLPARLMKSMEGFFDSARKRIRFNDDAKLEREWTQKVRVVATTQPLLPPAIDEDVFDNVSNALYHNNLLTISYCNASGEEKTKDVLPLGLAQQGTRFYLVCRFQGYNNERSVALHRIKTAKVSTLTFARPADFDLKKYDDDGRFLFGEGESVTLEFMITKEAGQHLLESRLSHDQVVEETATGHYRITATVIDSLMLKNWLRSFGEEVISYHTTPTDQAKK